MLSKHNINLAASCLLLSLLLSSNSATADSLSTTKVKLQTSTEEAFTPKQTPVDFSNFGGANTQEDSHEMWQALREQYFSDRPIIEEGTNRIHLKAPARAENDALVPVLIDLDKGDSSDPFKKVYLVVDVNPAPMGGIFKLANNRPMEQLKTSVRVNGYTYIAVNIELFKLLDYLLKANLNISLPDQLNTMEVNSVQSASESAWKNFSSEEKARLSDYWFVLKSYF